MEGSTSPKTRFANTLRDMAKWSRLQPEILDALDFDAQSFANTLRDMAKTSKLLPRSSTPCAETRRMGGSGCSLHTSPLEERTSGAGRCCPGPLRPPPQAFPTLGCKQTPKTRASL